MKTKGCGWLEGNDVGVVGFFFAFNQLKVPQYGELVLCSHGGEIEFGAYFLEGDFAFVCYKLVQGFLQVV